ITKAATEVTIGLIEHSPSLCGSACRCWCAPCERHNLISREAQAAPPPHTRLVIMADDLLSMIGTRADNGDRLTFEWGEPDEHGWYTPAITQHSDDNPIRDAEVR